MSMGKRLAAIIAIFFCTCVAWAILGSTIFARTYSFTDDLKGRVASTWGTRQEQKPVAASYQQAHTKAATYYEKGVAYVRPKNYTTTEPLPLDSSQIDVKIDLEHRQKGLLWYSTYKVQFGGDYRIRNPSAETQLVTFELPYPASQAIYDDLQFTLNGKPLVVTNSRGTARATADVPAGATAVLHAQYKSQGLDQWEYKLGDDIAQVRDFSLRMHTNFDDIDFPMNTLSPTTKQQTGDGWQLDWRYNNLVSGYQIGMVMPEKLQPGPLAGQISYFAPVSLLFFFFLMFIITTLRGIELHPMNYFFLATAFFAFHLLMAYLVDHISIHLAFAISAAVSLFLVVTYLRLVVGMRFAAMEAAGAQFIYLVLFSYAFFFKGYTGLAVTIGAIITLFVVMQMTGRIRWAEKFASPMPAKA